MRHNAERLQKMERKAITLGLGNPASILANELDGAKIQLYLHQKAHQRLVTATPSQRLLEDVVDFESESDENVEDAESVFELDEEGFVVL